MTQQESSFKTSFKAGDIVKCINNLNEDGSETLPYIPLGGVFEVSQVDVDLLCFKNSIVGGYYASRFELVEEDVSEQHPAQHLQKPHIGYADYIRSCVDSLNKAILEANAQGITVLLSLDEGMTTATNGDIVDSVEVKADVFVTVKL